MTSKDDSDKKAPSAADLGVIAKGPAQPQEPEAGPEVDEPEMFRFSVNLAADSAAVLRRTASRKGITVTDAFRRAVAIMEGIDKELSAGREIESVDPATGARKGIVFL